jgi:hypothetical protein
MTRAAEAVAAREVTQTEPARRRRTEALPDFARQHWLCIAAVVIALLVRVAFVLYTRRVWEDALITITPARNLWLGNGLTHHISEPRIHSFTSPISVLIPIIGEAVHAGLRALRLASLVGAVGAVVYAYRIGRLLQIPTAAMVLLLGYLAFDHLQVFFGMAGMETQVATAILLANVYYLLQRQWRALGICCGLAMLARPENVLWIAVVAVVLCLAGRLAWKRWLPGFLVLTVPWLAFTTWYYGSPIPHTIVAKSFYNGGVGRTPSLHEEWLYLTQWWTVLAPFRSFSFVGQTPVPTFLLQLVALVIVVAALQGAREARRAYPLLLAVPAMLILFFLYRTRALLPSYFMWYLPPLTALTVLLATLGMRRWHVTAPRSTNAIAITLAALFLLPLPFMWPLDKTVQRDLEYGVREKTGQYLDQAMGPHDTVVLEPLGYIGIAAFNKTTYDWPGLSSKVVTDHLATMKPGDRSLIGLVNELHPTFAVLRPAELAAFRSVYPQSAAQYTVDRSFKARPDLNLTHWHTSYFSIDTEFVVLRRR